MICRDKASKTRAKKIWWVILSFVLCTGVFLPRPAVAADTIETSGDIIQILIPAVAYGTTFYLDDKEGRMQFYKSFFTTIAVTQGLKFTIDKDRPNGSEQSFPSGHTSAAFQGATFIHQRYGLNYGIPAYIAASFVGYSRVEADKHYIEDVLAGAAIGAASSLYFTEPYKGVKITPVAGSGYYGVTLSGIF